MPLSGGKTRQYAECTIEPFGRDFMATIVNTKGEGAAQAGLNGFACDAGNCYGLGRRRRTGALFGENRPTFERVALAPMAADRPTFERKRMIAPTVKMDERRRYRLAIGWFRQRVPKDAREGDRPGNSIAEMADRIPGHRGTLREAADYDSIGTKAEAALKVVENLADEADFVTILRRRILIGPCAPLPVDGSEGEAMSFGRRDEVGRAHLIGGGTLVTVEKDVDASLRLASRAHDPIFAIRDAARYIVAAIRLGANCRPKDLSSG